jgi:hypothetical protein
MLVILGMLMARMGDPNMWRWLADDDSAPSQPRQFAPGAKPSSAGPVESVEAPAKPPVATGPTDEDPDEGDAVREEFQAVTDGTLEMQVEEMVAYNRLVRWVHHQPAELMLQRARHDLVFTHFMQSPNKYRGKLVTLELNLRRVLEGGQSADGIPLHEAWGWTTESKAWLYDVVVIDMPPEMPVGPNVTERATMVGYFFKLQGYHEAGAKPNAPALKAPVFIGRLVWRPATPVKIPSSDWTWIAVGGIVLALFIMLQFAYFQLRQPRRTNRMAVASGPRPGRLSVEEWLNLAQTTGVPEGNNSEAQTEKKEDGP